MTTLRLILSLLLATAVWSTEPALTATDIWTRATAPSAANGAVFLTLSNTGDADLRITAANSPACANAELHGHRATATGMQMYELDALTVPAKGKLELVPGGLHVMLLGLTAPLKEGATVTLDLTVEGAAAPLRLEAKVLGIAAMGLTAEASCCPE